MTETTTVNDRQTRLAAAVDLLLTAAEHVNDAALGTIDTLGWEDAATLLADLRTAVSQHIGPVDASLVRQMYLTGPHGTALEVEGVGVVEISRSQDRKEWDHRATATAVLDAHLSRSETGEAPGPWEVLDWLMDAAGLNYWRVRQLRALGVDPGVFCSEVPGKPTVRITRPS